MTTRITRFEVPRSSVDFLEDDLTGRKKLTVLKYLGLEETLDELGLQQFGKNTVNNVFLQPVREWVSKNWNEEFSYDFSKRTIPISFRASLAVGLFETKVIDYLTGLGKIELYPSRSIREILGKNGLPIPNGLTEIDYSSLQEEVKRELAIPIVENLNNAETVAKANLLFPNGINKTAVMAFDLGMLFEMFDGQQEETIHFDRIRNLDFQARAARQCLGNYLQVKSLESVLQETRDRNQSEGNPLDLKTRRYDEPRVEIFKYEKGTTLFDIFKLRNGESKQEVLKAFKRRAIYGTSYRMTCEGERGDYVELTLDENGNMNGKYVFTDYGDPSEDEPLKFNALTDMAYPKDGTVYDEFRCEAVQHLIEELRDEIDTTRESVEIAKAQYQKTCFTAEIGFLEALTLRRYRETKGEELAEEVRLVREAKRTAGIFGKLSNGEPSKNLVSYSDKPVDDRVLELDYAIQRSIKENYDLDMSEMFASCSGMPVYKDNLGDWFSSVNTLLSKFKGVLVDSSQLFSVLGIPPTNEEADISRAYREVSRLTHPDRTLDLSPEERLKATDRFIQATSAYRNLIARVGSHDLDSLNPTYYLGRISKLFEKENN